MIKTGDFMKRILIVSISGILIGSMFAVFMFSNIKKNKTVMAEVSNNEVTAFQVGVYSVLDNAEKAASAHENSYIYKDEDKYRVFLAIYKDQDIINYMIKHFESNNIEIYFI